ncbi:MAG: hypothetical protein GY800_02165, partial [Planctomycetes bacterium]|nr:hypothetical protein [Planctomycetota bacterium]
MMIVDFETYSAAGYMFRNGQFVGLEPKKSGLNAVGAWVYSEHRTTEVICMGYGVPGSFRLWYPGDPLPDIPEFTAQSWFFEYAIWNNVCVPKYGFKPIHHHKITCTAARSRAYSLPGSLAEVGKALDLAELKDDSGKDLIKLLSVPQKPTKAHPVYRRERAEYPELFQAMDDYCLQDLKAEHMLYEHTPELTPDGFEVFKLDQDINVRGCEIDVDNITKCNKIVQAVVKKYNAELFKICGLKVSQSVALAEFCGLPSVDKEHVQAALSSDHGTPDQRRA